MLKPHLFKHPHLGLHDVYDVWTNDPLFYPAKPPAHWLMCAEVAGRVLVVPLAPPRDGDPVAVDQSDATRLLPASLISTGGTDDRPHDDSRRGVRLLRPA